MRSGRSIVSATMWLFLFVSPIGAPLVGAVISYCPPDPVVVPTGPFALEIAYCGVSRPVEQLYQQAIVLSFLPIMFAGPIIGGFVTAAWWSAAIVSAVGVFRHLWRAFAVATIERL